MRIFLRDLPIGRKVTVITMLTTITALLLAGIAFTAYELIMFRQGMQRDVAAMAEIVGANSTAALAFRDPRAAAETLDGLRAEPHILNAAIYDHRGALFAEYRRHDSRFLAPRGAPAVGHHFSTEHLTLTRPIVLDGERIGTVTVQSDLEELRARLRRYAGIVALVMIASLLVALSLSWLLQRVISRPVLGLARTARIVSTERNYSLRATKEGEDEIGLLIDAFNEMLGQIQQRDLALQERTAELERANKELGAFSYSVSHDLRAPLRSIDGFSQALLEDYEALLDDEGRDYLRRVREASQRMGQMIDDFLQLARVSRGELQRTPIDLGDIAQRIVGELREREPERRVNVKIHSGATATGDPHLLRIVLENLLGNSWKFTRRHAEANIEFGVTHNNGTRTFYVRDDGAGFDPAKSDKLFGAFQRLHTADEFEGTGIGLATVQRIIHRHGGRLWAEGEIEKGATFYFTL